MPLHDGPVHLTAFLRRAHHGQRSLVAWENHHELHEDPNRRVSTVWRRGPLVTVVVSVRARRLRDPGLGENAPAFPKTALRVQDPQLEQIRGLHGETIATRIDVIRPEIPLLCHDSERRKEARLQVFVQCLACDLRENGGQHVAGGTGVHEGSTGLVHQRNLEELSRPAAGDASPDRPGGLFSVPRAHRQQMLHGHRCKLSVDGPGDQLREERDDLILQPEAPFLERHADGTCHDTLGGRMHDAGTIRPVRPPPAFGHHAAGTMEHQSMYVETGGRGVIQKCRHDCRVDARFARLAAPETVRMRVDCLFVRHMLPSRRILYFYRI